MQDLSRYHPNRPKNHETLRTAVWNDYHSGRFNEDAAWKTLCLIDTTRRYDLYEKMGEQRGPPLQYELKSFREGPAAVDTYVREVITKDRASRSRHKK